MLKQRKNYTSYSGKYVKTRVGDRLDGLAYRYYTDVSKWSTIARANNIMWFFDLDEEGSTIFIPQNPD